MAATLAAPLTVEIPAELARALTEELGAQGVARWALETVLLQAIREGRVTVGYAGECLGIGALGVDALLKARGGPLILSEADRHEDAADRAEIRARLLAAPTSV